MRLSIYFLAVFLCRAFDLWTTWLVTPTLDYELNPLIRWIGWRRTIAANVILVVTVAMLSPFIPTWSLCLACAWWVSAGCWNLRTVWKLEQPQRDGFKRYEDAMVKRASWHYELPNGTVVWHKGDEGDWIRETGDTMFRRLSDK